MASSVVLDSISDCWSISIKNEFDGKIRVGGCVCHRHEDLQRQLSREDFAQKMAHNFRINGVIIIEAAWHQPVFLKNSGALFFESDLDFFPVVNSRGEPANITETTPLCLCYGCQNMRSAMTDDCVARNHITNLIVSCGWFGLTFFGLCIL